MPRSNLRHLHHPKNQRFVIITGMDSQLLYQQDASVLEFTATVVERRSLQGGRVGVVLDRTYFYPTGGGQEHDTGTLGGARVVDVFKDEDNHCLVHVVQGEVPDGPVIACIDADRRLRHMQSHTAQHLLTQCLLRETGAETVSANINGYTPSTLDVTADHINKPELEKAELLANQVIYQNLPVKTYFVSPEELTTIPLRRPPKVNENIRIVEIDGFDYSPCGGTHVLQTGSIGLVKVLRTERLNEKTRVYFISGIQAFELFHQMYEDFAGLANRMSTGIPELPDLISRQVEQIAGLQKELQVLRLLALKAEAQQLATNARENDVTRLAVAEFRNRPANELRLLGEDLRVVNGLVAYLLSYDGLKLSLVVACGEGSGKDARTLLTQALSVINGRGGGDASLAQGGGSATEAQYKEFVINLG